ncbi:MAG: energy transducer TonB [Flavobacteriales bacterium]
MITTALILGFLLLTTLLATGAGWNNVLSPDRNDLVFAGRNQEYGAYRMRREHHRTMILAMLIGFGLAGAAVGLPLLFRGEVVVGPQVPVVRIDERIIDIFDPPAAAKSPDPRPQPPTPPPSGPVLGAGPLVAVDSVPTADVDTTTTSDPGPSPGLNPGGGTPGPDPGPSTGEGGNTGGGTSTVKNGWELESMPEYPGGEAALHKYLSREVNYPEIDIVGRREGRVTVGFIIRSDGTVTDVKVLQGVSPTIDAEAERVVRRMIKWKPGKFNQREVDVRYALPIVFKLKN